MSKDGSSEADVSTANFKDNILIDEEAFDISEQLVWLLLCACNSVLLIRNTVAQINVLKDVFKRFDVDKDDALNVDELQTFARACGNSAGFSDDELAEMREHLQCRDDGALLEDGFIGMYALQTLSEPDETWRDLQALGYDDKLQKADKPKN